MIMYLLPPDTLAYFIYSIMIRTLSGKRCFKSTLIQHSSGCRIFQETDSINLCYTNIGFLIF